MKRNKPRLSLDRPATYQIEVPGTLDVLWIDDDDAMCVEVEESTCEQPISILTGSMDQAALHSLLRRLYAMGLPLISVIWADCEKTRIKFDD